MSSESAIVARSLGKSFPVYAKPHHRLLQMFSRQKHRWYREFHALRGVDLEVRRGETLGIVGRNGSGKSTLLQLICGTLAPSHGEVVVNGRIAALLELGAGFNPEFTGRENVYLNGSILGLSRREVEQRFDRIVAFADIGEFIDQPVKTYSSGMYVRLAFAVAINVDPEILVVDEALSVGDEGFQRKCFARIDALKEGGATILFVSHSAGTVVELCDRAILLDRGELIADGTPKLVVSRYHKLLNTPAGQLLHVRQEIRDADVSCDPPAAGATRDQPPAPPAPDPEEDAWLDEGLKSASTVQYERRGAQIIAPHLRTPGGRPVNILVPGGEYVYTYEVLVEHALHGVRCGMMIRTVTGIDLGGAVSDALGGADGQVAANSRLRVAIPFRCLLTPGAYFLNAGVQARMPEGDAFVDRIVDVGMFRVLPSLQRRATGIVDFDVAPRVETIA